MTNAKDLNAYSRYFYPGIVDIMPAIAQFMNIDIPEKYKREIDGISLTAPVSVAEPKANLIQGNLDVTWKSFNKNEKVKIFVTATNNFKEGVTDDYKLAGEFLADQEHALISVKDLSSDIYKVVIQGKYNTVNKWVVVPQK